MAASGPAAQVGNAIKALFDSIASLFKWAKLGLSALADTIIAKIHDPLVWTSLIWAGCTRSSTLRSLLGPLDAKFAAYSTALREIRRLDHGQLLTEKPSAVILNIAIRLQKVLVGSKAKWFLRDYKNTKYDRITTGLAGDINHIVEQHKDNPDLVGAVLKAREEIEGAGLEDDTLGLFHRELKQKMQATARSAMALRGEAGAEPSVSNVDIEEAILLEYPDKFPKKEEDWAPYLRMCEEVLVANRDLLFDTAWLTRVPERENV